MKNFLKKNRYLILTIFLTITIIFINLFFNHTYPFGKNTFNGVDFSSGYIPVYYKLWDLLHGYGSIIFDWNLGAGLNVFGSFVMNGLISPTSLLIGIFPRESIPYTIMYILILKLITISICSYISLNKLFPKLKDIYKTILTLFYTFSGWTLLMESHLLYLDAVALFPLFIVAYKKLITENKSLNYIIILTLVLMLNYYMAWMYLFFIFGISIISMLCLDIKDKKQKSVKIFLATLLSLGLSCILFLPGFYQSFSSYRMESMNDFITTSKYLLLDKIIYLIPSGILFALTFKKMVNSSLNLYFNWYIY